MKNNDLSTEESCRNKISFHDDEVTKKSTIYIHIFLEFSRLQFLF